MHWNTLQHTAIHFKNTATHSQHTATHCNTLQHIATHCITRRTANSILTLYGLLIYTYVNLHTHTHTHLVHRVCSTHIQWVMSHFQGTLTYSSTSASTRLSRTHKQVMAHILNESCHTLRVPWLTYQLLPQHASHAPAWSLWSRVRGADYP